MKFAFKSLAAAAFMMIGAAHAGTVTVDAGTGSYKGWKVSGFETLTLSADTLAALDTGRMSAAASGSVVGNITKDSDDYFLSVQVKTSITSLAVDDFSNQVLSATAKGGLTLTANVLRSVSTGGSLTITDLKADLSSKRIYATLIGGNGVGTLPNYYLWDITGPVASPALAVGANTGQPNNTIFLSGLKFSTDGFNQVVKSLGLVLIGRSQWSTIPDFGVVAVKVDPVVDDSGTPPVTPPPPTCAGAYKATPVSATTFDATVTVSNSGTTAASNWQINWTYGTPTLVLKVKSVALTNLGSTKLTATPASTNKVIAAGGSTTFSLRAYANSVPPAVSGLTATLGGQNCSVSVE